MKPSTLEWIAKAEDDFTVALREYRARKNPSYDGACFHTQQCAEKYLKARLEEAGLPIQKTHDLPKLLTQALPIEPTWHVLNPDLLALNIYSVAFRYPGASANKAVALDAVKRCRRVRQTVRLSFGLPV